MRLRGRGKDRALRGVGSERPNGGKSVNGVGGDELVKDEMGEEVGEEEGSSAAKAIVVENDEKPSEGSPSKRRRVGEGGESVPTGVREDVPARRKPTRVPVISQASSHTSKLVPAKRPIEAVVPKRPAAKPPAPKSGRSAVKSVGSRAPANTRPSATSSTAGPSRPPAAVTARSAGTARSTLPKPAASKPPVPRPRDVTKT